MLFSFVPQRHQLLVTNAGCLLETFCLSYIKWNGFPFKVPGFAEEGMEGSTPPLQPDACNGNGNGNGNGEVAG
jgi:hypothetical protein